MPMYTKRPVTVEARLYDRLADFEHACDVAEWAGAEMISGAHFLQTLEGPMRISDGDYVIKEPFPTDDRKFYPCKPTIFADSYLPAEEIVENHLEMTEARFAMEIGEALLLEAEAVGSSDVDTAIRVAARVAANYGLVKPNNGEAFEPVDDPATTEF